MGRRRVLEALREADTPATKIRRFRECGQRCWVQYSRSTSTYRFVANYCGSRFCVPCARARAKVIQERLKRLIGNHRVRMITFTRKATERTLVEALDDLRTPFRHVRESVLWKDAVKGWASFVEIKKGKDGVRWHVHLHVLVIGTWIESTALRAAWLEATGDSHIVDVMSRGNRDSLAGYAAAYASKGWGSELFRDAAGLKECVAVLGGRRLFSTGGDWRGAELQDQSDPVTDWRNVGRFHVVYAAAIRGEEWARGVFTSIGVIAGAKVGAPSFLAVREAPSPELGSGDVRRFAGSVVRERR